MTKENTWVIRRVVNRLRNNLKVKIVFTLISVSVFIILSSLIYGSGKNFNLSPIAYALGETNYQQSVISQPTNPILKVDNGVVLATQVTLNPNNVSIKVDESVDEQQAKQKAQAEAKAKKRAEVIARSTPKRVEVVGDVQSMGHDRVVQVWGEDQWPAFQAIVQIESGWVVGNRNNHSGACGLGQAYPCSKLGSNYGNAMGEINWTINYILGRYSTPSNALAFHYSHGWY
jgi:hypothetical protein